MIQHRPDRKKPWRARVRMPDGSEAQRSFQTKSQAQQWERAQRHALDRGDAPDPNAGRRTFDRWTAELLDSRVDLAPKTLLEYRDSAQRVNTHLGDMLLMSIRKQHVASMMGALNRDGFAPETINKALKLTKMVLGEAVQNRMLRDNPAVNVKRMPNEHRDMRILTASQVNQLADACHDYRLLVLTAAYSGLRWGELVGLQADRIVGNTIRVDRQLSEAAGSFTWRFPKSKAGVRNVPIPDGLATQLADRTPGVEGLVFPSVRGMYLRHSGFRRRRWLPAVEATVGQPVTFHDLRHTHAAWLIADGVHPKAMQLRLGHSSIQVTMDRYGHLMPGMDDTAWRGMDVRFGEQVGPDAAQPS